MYNKWQHTSIYNKRQDTNTLFKIIVYKEYCVLILLTSSAVRTPAYLGLRVPISNEINKCSCVFCSFTQLCTKCFEAFNSFCPLHDGDIISALLDILLRHEARASRVYAKQRLLTLRMLSIYNPFRILKIDVLLLSSRTSSLFNL